MTILTRLRRALCRHDWQPVWRQLPLAPLGVKFAEDAKCRKCGVMRRLEP